VDSGEGVKIRWGRVIWKASLLPVEKEEKGFKNLFKGRKKRGKNHILQNLDGPSQCYFLIKRKAVPVLG